jgi:sortase (surface protein transpeptidase)
MKAWYADSKGRVHVYAVKWWKVSLPTNASWAWAAQSRPSMTLQTCVGKNSKYRLVVRLVEVGG